MIRRSLQILALFCATVSRAQEPEPAAVPAVDAEAPTDAAEQHSPFAIEVEVAPEPPPIEDPLAPYRLPFLDLAQRTIGTTSRPVAFDWRQSKFQLGGTASFLAELNNFDSARFGAVGRFPGEKLIFEVDVTWVGVWGTRSSRMLALTPYRQAGRPKRGELGLGVAIPLGEGVVTLAPRVLPATEMVLNAYADLRYLVYPKGFRDLGWKDTAKAILTPQLNEAELANLEAARLGGMQLDPARYEMHVGLGNDLYFDGGFFLSPRVMIGVPLLAPATGSELGFWGDLRLVAGVAF